MADSWERREHDIMHACLPFSVSRGTLCLGTPFQAADKCSARLS